MATSAMGGGGVMKRRNVAPRVRFEPLPLAFQVSVLTITPPILPDAIAICMTTCLCCFLPERSLQITTLLFCLLLFYVLATSRLIL